MNDLISISCGTKVDMEIDTKKADFRYIEIKNGDNMFRFFHEKVSIFFKWIFFTQA